MTTQYTENVVATMTKITAFVMMCVVFVGAPSQALAAVNLIVNGDFETPDVSNALMPAGWFTGHQFAGATTSYSYPVAGVTGNGAQVSIESTIPDADAKWYFAQVPVTGGKEYQFTNAYSATNPTQIVVEFFDASNQHLSYGGFFPIAPTLLNSWGTTNVLFTAPDNAAYATIFHSIQNGTLTVDDYVLTKVIPSAPVVFNKGIVSLTFDDGWYSQFTHGVPVLNAHNIPGSFYIISGAMTRPGDGYATSTTILNAQSVGHEIGAHTVNHCNLATGICPDSNPANIPDLLTSAQEIINSRNEILGIGATPVETFVYPYGAFLSPETTDEVAAAGFIGARTTQEGYNNKTSNPYTLKTYIVDRAITEGNFSVVQNWIDTAAQNREWLILSFHQIEDLDTIAARNLDGATTPEFFAQINDYIAQKRDANEILVKSMGSVLEHCMDADESDCVSEPLSGDVVPPVITIDPYDATMTNQNVVVTAHTNEGTLNATSHTFTENGSFSFVATDAAGNSTTVIVLITNIDKTAPVITPVSNITADATSLAGAQVVYTLPVSTDPIVCTPGSGTLFALGTTTVNCIATDAAGNTSTSAFTVTVADTSAPVITIDAFATTPTNQDVVVTAHTNEGTLNATSHTFTENGSFSFIATDTAGNVGTSVVTVTHIDKTAPVITPAANVIAEATGATGAIVAFTSPVSTDPIVCTPGSGTLFALGTTTVNCIATDAAGNTSTTAFTVTVADTSAPVITIDAFTTTPTNQDVVVTAHTNEGTLNATSHTFTANGSFSFIATDTAGNVGTSVVTVTHIDKTAPVITPAANVIAEATGATGAIVAFTSPVSTDPIVCTPGSGTLFALGTTTVNCIATDAAGNTSTSAFTVTVQDTTAPVLTLTGANPQGIALGAPYVEQGATALDTVSGDRTSAIVTNASAVNTNVAGTYVVTYNVLDAAGNAATQMTRTVQVAPRTLGVVANPQTKVFGTVDPQLTYSLATGALLAGDVFTGSLVRTTGEATGTYPISLGSLTAGPNYALSFTGASLTIVSPTCTNGRILRGNECVKPGITGSKKPKVAVVIPAPTVLGTSTTSTTTPAVKYIFVTTMQIGSQSAEVTELQKRLAAEGLYIAQITGYFGILTQAAVKAYQILHGIDPVGIVGPLTRAALNK